MNRLYAGMDSPLSASGSHRAVIIPVPYDGTSTWGKGADRGPAALLNATDNMEVYDMETGEILDKSYRMNDTYNFSFWHPILQCPKFNEFIEKKYRVASGNIMHRDEVASVYEDLEDE